MIFYYQLKNYFLKPNWFFFFLLCFSPLFQFKSIIYSLYPTCIVLAFYLYRTCIVLVLSVSFPCLSLSGFLPRFFIPTLYCACILLVLYLHCRFYLSFRLLPSIKPLSTSPCIVLVLYLYCGIQSIFHLLSIIYPPRHLVLYLYCTCIVPPTLSTPRIHHTSHITHHTSNSSYIVLVLYLHRACILLILSALTSSSPLSHPITRPRTHPR